MSPKYFKFRVWDDRPYGAAEARKRDCLTVIFNNNRAPWYDYIRAKQGGFFLSERLTLRLLQKAFIDFGDAVRCQPDSPLQSDPTNPFPGYWFVSPKCFWDASATSYLWRGQTEESSRWIVGSSAAPSRIGSMRDSRSGVRGHRFCDMALVLLARTVGATNFHFAPLDLPDHPDASVAPFKIDYAGRNWPPQWYPDGFEPHPNNLTAELPPDPLKAK